MKKFNMKLKIRKLSAVLLASAVAATAFLTLPFVASAATIDTSKFTAYFSEDMSNTDPTPADFDSYWGTTTDGDALKYKDMGLSDWNNQTRKNMATLYYNVKEYSNFELTFKFEQWTNTNLLSFFFGFGAKMGQNWYKDRDKVAAYSLLMDHGALMSCYQENWLSDGNNRGAAQIPSYSATAAHTIKVKYVSGAVSVYMDGYQIYAGNKTVNPGYIWFASKAGTTIIYEPTVTELKSISDYENVFDVYYSSDMKTADPTPEAVSNHWRLSSDTERLVRKDNDSNWAKYGPNMAVLYLKKVYNNFDLTTSFSITDNVEGNGYFGIGAEKGKSWASDTASSVFTFHQSGGLMNGKTGDWITGGGQTPADKITDYNKSGVHTLHVRVLDKVYTVWVDDIQVGSGAIQNYKGGYIWFGADDMLSSWGVPTVTELKSVSDFENVFEAYYSSDMKTVDPAPETMTNHWGLTSDTTRLSRKTNDSSWTRFGPNMAILYLKKTYNNFDLTTTFSIPGNSDYDVYFGVGAEKGKSWANDNAAAFTLHRSGGLMNGKAENWITGGGQTPADKISGYNVTGVHTLRLKVLDKVYTAWVDDIQVGSGTLSNYTEGYVWFGADDMTATWGIPTVTELPDTELLKYDVNGDNAFDSSDVVFLRKVLLGIEEANQKCDVSDDGNLDILDLIAMKKFLANAV